MRCCKCGAAALLVHKETKKLYCGGNCWHDECRAPDLRGLTFHEGHPALWMSIVATVVLVVVVILGGAGVYLLQ